MLSVWSYPEFCRLVKKGLYVTQHIKFVFHRMETILEKGENA